MTIDGIEKAYFVYQGEEITPGDFVELIQGNASKEGTFSASATTLQFVSGSKTYSISTMREVVALNDNTVFVYAHSGSFDSFRYHGLVLQATSDTGAFALKCYTTMYYYGYYDCLRFVNDHTLLHIYGHDDNNYENYVEVIYVSEDYSSISKSEPLYREGNTSYGYGGEYLPLTDNTGVVFLDHYSGGEDSMYYFVTFSGSSMTYTAGKYLYYTDGTMYANGFGNANYPPIRISDTQFIYALSNVYLLTVDVTNQTVTVAKMTTDNTFLTATSWERMGMDDNLIVYPNRTSTSANVYFYVNQYDVNTLTIKQLYNFSIPYSTYPPTDIFQIDGTHVAYVSSSSRLIILEITPEGYTQYEPITINVTYSSYNDMMGTKAIAMATSTKISIFNLPYPELQVRKALTQTNHGIAKTGGVGGTEQVHNEQVTVIIPNTTE